MSLTPARIDETTLKYRLCARIGCGHRVNKPTAKYCSVGCCATDPERINVLRARSRERARTVLPLSRQLTMPFAGTNNPEAMLGLLCEGRDDVPGGMSRLVV
jgi:hypothetical protein